MDAESPLTHQSPCEPSKPLKWLMHRPALLSCCHGDRAIRACAAKACIFRACISKPILQARFPKNTLKRTCLLSSICMAIHADVFYVSEACNLHRERGHHTPKHAASPPGLRPAGEWWFRVAIKTSCSDIYTQGAAVVCGVLKKLQLGLSQLQHFSGTFR